MPDEMPEHEQGEIVDIVIEDERWEDVDLLGICLLYTSDAARRAI